MSSTTAKSTKKKNLLISIPADDTTHRRNSTKHRRTPTQVKISKHALKGCPTGIKGGMLVKRGKTYKTWKKRICVLKDPHLYYYVDSEDEKPRGVIYIPRAKIELEEKIFMDKQHSFGFSVESERSWKVPDNKLFLGRKYYFCTNSFQELSEWMAILKTISSM